MARTGESLARLTNPPAGFHPRRSNITNPEMETPKPPTPQWRKLNEGGLSFIESECENCGSDLTMVFTSSGTRFLWDGDPIKCRDCDHAGTISVVDGEAFCAWGEIDQETRNH